MTNALNSQAMIQLQNQRVGQEMEFQTIVTQAQQITSDAQKLTDQRTEYLEQYRKTTGELVKDDAELEKWKELSKKQIEGLKKGDASPKVPAAADKPQPARYLRNYLNLDLVVEKKKLLESFGVEGDDN